MLDNEPFNQTRSYLTWREADSLPYNGWEIIPNFLKNRRLGVEIRVVP